MATYLDQILVAHRVAAAADARSLDALIEQCSGLAPTRPFRQALIDVSAADGSAAVIAEIKRRSPSKGDLAPDLDPADLARSYEVGGAACLSVLTDTDHFGGSTGDLRAARAACSLPVLRKDFTVDARDVCDARLMGADCVLLIAAAMPTDELASLHRLAVGLGLDVLVEIHDEHEMSRAVGIGADLIGVNQRDLVTFEVDTARAVRMAPLIPAGAVAVAESGIATAADAQALASAGYRALLVGEALVTSGSPAESLRAIRGM